MNIYHESPVPLHLQAEQILRDMIEQEEYRNGKLLPNEVDLARQMGISRNTLRQAINALVYEGKLVRKTGVGTKAVKKGIRCGVKNWLSFSQEMKHLGITVKNYELHVSLTRPSLEAANFFDIQENTRCMVLERLRGNTEHPFVYFISHFNPRLPICGEDDFSAPLYEMLENKYGIVVKTSKEEISARLAGDFFAGKLDISPSDPILVRKRLVYDENGVPVEYNIGYYRADSFTYTIEADR